MPTITVRKLDENTKQALRERAAAHGISMEEEARRILTETVRCDRPANRPTVEDIMAFGIKTKVAFSQKDETDALWSYIDHQ